MSEDLAAYVDSVMEPVELMAAMARFPVVIFKAIPFEEVPPCEFCPVHDASRPLDTVAVISYRHWIDGNPATDTPGYYSHTYRHYCCTSDMEWELRQLTRPQRPQVAEDLTVEVLMIPKGA